MCEGGGLHSCSAPGPPPLLCSWLSPAWGLECGPLRGLSCWRSEEGTRATHPDRALAGPPREVSKQGRSSEIRWNLGITEAGEGAQGQMVLGPTPPGWLPKALSAASPLPAGQASALGGPGVLNTCHKNGSNAGRRRLGVRSHRCLPQCPGFPCPVRALLGVGGLPGCENILARQAPSNAGGEGAPRRPRSPRF